MGLLFDITLIGLNAGMFEFLEADMFDEILEADQFMDVLDADIFIGVTFV